MKRFVYSAITAVVALGATLPAYAARTQFVAVSSIAAAGYQRPADANGNPQPEAYVLAEGHFMQGTTKDVPLEKHKFNDLLQPLARSLAKQKYFPATNPNDADLVLVVHWGVTTIANEPLKDLAIDNLNAALSDYSAAASAGGGGIADPGDINAISDQLEGGFEASTNAMARNATLLGYAHTLRRLAGSNLAHLTTTERTLYDELREERYFVVLMAYDFKSYKEKKSALKWVTRLSMRSPGNNFNEAVLMLAETGGNVFGRNLDKLSHVKGRVRDGEVTLGELRVLGEGE